MMAIASNPPAPGWRNFVGWSLAGACFYAAAVLVASLVMGHNPLDAMTRSGFAAGAMGLGLLLAAGAAGVTGRKMPVGGRTLRNFLIRNLIAMAAFLLAIWGFGALAGAGSIGTSEWVAAITGATLIVTAFLGTLVLAGARTGAGLIDNEEAVEDMRDRSRLFLLSYVWMIACGLMLIVPSLAAAGVLPSREAALASVAALVAAMAVLSIAVWRLCDELSRALSLEAGNMACYLILLIGGGWAILAHFGFAPAPAPLDWLTLFIVLLFAASFIAVARRKLLTA